MKTNTNSSGSRSKISGTRTTVRVTANNYESIKTAMKRFLILEIRRYETKAGGQNRLSVLLGYSDKKVAMVTKRQSFSALERLWKECREKLG